MKAITIALCLAVLPLAACETVKLGAPPNAVVPGALTVADDQKYAQALNAYNALAESYLVAVRTGRVPQAAKDQAKAASRVAIAALNAADTARKAGNATTFTAQVALATQATAEFRAVLPKGN